LFVYYVGVVKAMRERGMARCALKMFARCARGSERERVVRWRKMGTPTPDDASRATTDD